MQAQEQMQSQSEVPSQAMPSHSAQESQTPELNTNVYASFIQALVVRWTFSQVISATSALDSIFTLRAECGTI